MSEFVDERKVLREARQRGDAAARARQAREERAQREQRLAQEQHASAATAAASTLQRAVRRAILTPAQRDQSRAEWDAAMASAEDAGPPAASIQLVLTAWLVHFFAGDADAGRMRTLCRVLSAGLEQESAAHSFASGALRREAAVRWVSTLRRLLLALARLVSPAEPAAAALLSNVRADAPCSLAESSSGARKALSAHFGPHLRVLLTFGEPAKWRLATQLR